MSTNDVGFSISLIISDFLPFDHWKRNGISLDVFYGFGYILHFNCDYITYYMPISYYTVTSQKRVTTLSTKT